MERCIIESGIGTPDVLNTCSGVIFLSPKLILVRVHILRTTESGIKGKDMLL